MEFPQEDLDRFMMFELCRQKSEDTYARNPLDADNLTRWAGALLELSQSQNVTDAKAMIKEAITKLEEALSIDPRKHDALWFLGNAHTAYGYITSELDEAMTCFDTASQCFQNALTEDPGNQLYLKSLEVNAKAPALHMELHSHDFTALNQQEASGGSSTYSDTKGSNKKNNDLKYDIFGWVILAVGIVALMGLAKSHVHPLQQ